MKVSAKFKKSNAFTLVELAIVIVIIGLLVGGVLQGAELIKQAKYRVMMKDVESYKAAFLGFKAKYNCLAGDCNKGFSFFNDFNCGTNTVITDTNGNTGCNGNGNNILTAAEGQNAWRHLSYGKFIKGSYALGYQDMPIAGRHIPLVPVKDSIGITPVFANLQVSSANSCGYYTCLDHGAGNIFGYMNMKNVLTMGNVQNGFWAGTASGAFMTPMEAYEFDIKFDDGLKNSGSISGFKGRNPDNTPAVCGSTGPATNYLKISDEDRCSMVFDLGS